MLVQLGALQCNSIEVFLRSIMLFSVQTRAGWQLASVVRILAKRITASGARVHCTRDYIYKAR